jgi:hypothetical protein
METEKKTSVAWLKEEFERQRFIENIDFEKANTMYSEEISFYKDKIEDLLAKNYNLTMKLDAYEKIEKLNIYGKTIVVQTDAIIKKLRKQSEDCVILRAENQFGCILETPFFMADYGVTADDFIGEFEKQNMVLYMQKLELNTNQ